MDIRLVTDGEKWAVKRYEQRGWFRKRVKVSFFSSCGYEWETPNEVVRFCWMTRKDAEQLIAKLKCMEPATK